MGFIRVFILRLLSYVDPEQLMPLGNGDSHSQMREIIIDGLH
jgi:hypothetical protein